MNSTRLTDGVAMHAGGRGNCWINLRHGRDLPTVSTGAAGLKQVLEQPPARPLALASDDVDEDGVPDSIGGTVGPAAGS